MYLSVIIPAYNEQKRIARTLLEIDKYLSRQDYKYEILVVSDGSRDNTCHIVKNFQNLIKNLKLIANPENRGKGYVVRQGMLEAQGEFRIFTDADNSTSIDQVEKLLKFLKPQGTYDIAVGSRGLRKSVIKVHQPFYREIVGKLVNLLIQLVAVRGIWDTQCGFKLFGAKAAEDILKRCEIDRWGFDIEALAVAKKLGYRIKEVPIVWINDPESKVSFASGAKIIPETFKIKWDLIRHKYDQESKN